MEVFDVVVTESVMLDPEVFDLWVLGLGVSDIVDRRLAEFAEPGDAAAVGAAGTSAWLDTAMTLAQERDRLKQILRRDVVDQVRTYETLERYFHRPELLCAQFMRQLNPGDALRMLEGYYRLDDAVVRELLGRKLTTRLRKDLDDVSDHTGVPLQSCRRQFDNLRRVFNYLDENHSFQCRVAETIEAGLVMPRPMAQHYARIMFLFYHRFTIQYSRRRTQFLRCAELGRVAQSMMRHWLPGAGAAAAAAVAVAAAGVSPLSRSHTSASMRGGGLEPDAAGGAFGVDLDRALLAGLRDLRGLMDRAAQDELHRLVQAAIAADVPSSRTRKLQGKFRAWLKTLLKIASELNQSKELRDYFEDMVKLLETVRECSFSRDDTLRLVAACVTCMEQVPVIRDLEARRRVGMVSCWARFCEVVKVSADAILSCG